MVFVRFLDEVVTEPTAHDADWNENVEDRFLYTVKILNNLKAGYALLDHKLTLKVDPPFILYRNMNPFRSNANDIHYTVKAVYTNRLMLEVLIVDGAGRIFALQKLTCSYIESDFQLNDLRKRYFN